MHHRRSSVSLPPCLSLSPSSLSLLSLSLFLSASLTLLRSLAPRERSLARGKACAKRRLGSCMHADAKAIVARNRESYAEQKKESREVVQGSRRKRGRYLSKSAVLRSWGDSGLPDAAVR